MTFYIIDINVIYWSVYVSYNRAGEVDQRKLKKEFVHHRGRAVLHLGRQRHGARDTTAGERNNMIIWCRSSTYRQSRAYQAQVPNHRHEAQPDILCLSRTHDQDYDFFMQLHQHNKEQRAERAVASAATTT
jgi:hypothetical protein